MPSKIDIYSRGEIAAYLANLVKSGQIKACKHMRLDLGDGNVFFPYCEKQWASWKPADNVPLDPIAYNGPSSYSWPQCPSNCPFFEKVGDFLVSVSRDQFTQAGEQETVPTVGRTQAPAAVSPGELAFPEKVTIRRLIHYVPVSYWLYALGLLASAFMLGVQSTRIAFVREMFSLTPSAEVAKPTALNEPRPSPAKEPNKSVKADAPPVGGTQVPSR